MENKKINLTSILLIILIVAVIVATVVMIVTNNNKNNNSNNDTNATSASNTENKSNSNTNSNTNTNSNSSSTNSNTSTNTSSNTVDIKNYVGMWYDKYLKEEGSDICLALDENNNIVLTVGIHRTAVLDETIVKLEDNKIKFDDSNGFTGTLSLGNNKITLVYSVKNFNIENEKLEFEYKKERSNTQIISGYDIAHNWKPSTATKDGKEISLQEIYGTGIQYGGFLTLNKDNTYSRLIGITSDEVEKDLTGTYEIKANTILFTTKNGKNEKAKFDNGKIVYDYGDGIKVTFYPESNT